MSSSNTIGDGANSDGDRDRGRSGKGILGWIRRKEGGIGALLGSKTFAIGGIILLFWCIDAVFWRHLVPYDPQAMNPAHALSGPSLLHWFGTDSFGRDVFSRTLAGASTILSIAPAATALGLIGGITLGLIAAYYQGWVDDIVMRVVDSLLAFPIVVIAVLVLAILGPSVVNVVLVIGLVFTPYVARTVRSAALEQREREYVAAAKLLGNSPLYVMVVEILPNILAPIVVEATIRLGYAIFVSATLSFLTLGVQQPSPDWGLTISVERAYIQIAPWVVLFPAGALASLIVSVNLVVDGLQHYFEE